MLSLGFYITLQHQKVGLKKSFPPFGWFFLPSGHTFGAGIGNAPYQIIFEQHNKGTTHVEVEQTFPTKLRYPCPKSNDLVHTIRSFNLWSSGPLSINPSQTPRNTELKFHAQLLPKKQAKSAWEKYGCPTCRASVWQFRP